MSMIHKFMDKADVAMLVVVMGSRVKTPYTIFQERGGKDILTVACRT